MVKSNADVQIDRRIALIVGAVTVGLLVRNVATDLLPGDAGEFHFAAWNWGLAHPTGYPIYLLAGGLWQRLWFLFGLTPAFSLNLLSAFLTGMAAALFYWLMLSWLPGSQTVRRLGAVLAVAFFVANPTVRSQAVQAEVYALHALYIVAILLSAQHLVAAANQGSRGRRSFVVLALLVGLGLSHHATTLLLIPPLLIYLFLADRGWWRPVSAWPWAALAFFLPVLSYLYIPLRSGPDASPWYHQRLGDATLVLYDGTWTAFVDYVTGQSISVSFYSLEEALARPNCIDAVAAPFEWPGLLLLLVGLAVLIQLRNWPVLALTTSFLAVQQVFNLFYGIGDIAAYYIPAYLVACIWIGYAAAGIGAQFRWKAAPETSEVGDPPPANLRWQPLLVILLLILPWQLWSRYTPLMEQIEAESNATRALWEDILAADPPADAILISNDRNEIVPLFYLQIVEALGAGHTGLFPLMAPDPRFTDIGATVQSALDAGRQPVFLIKPMPGLEARFDLASRMPPLTEVVGAAGVDPPVVIRDEGYGPLHLVGFTPLAVVDGLQIDLQWRVDAPLAADYTTTVQLFDKDGRKLGQDDARPGGVYYPTSLWKIGERLLDSHRVKLSADARPARLLVGMYSGPDAELLAPPLDLPLTVDPPDG